MHRKFAVADCAGIHVLRIQSDQRLTITPLPAGKILLRRNHSAVLGARRIRYNNREALAVRRNMTVLEVNMLYLIPEYRICLQNILRAVAEIARVKCDPKSGAGIQEFPHAADIADGA